MRPFLENELNRRYEAADFLAFAWPTVSTGAGWVVGAALASPRSQADLFEFASSRMLARYTVAFSRAPVALAADEVWATPLG